MDGRDDGRLVGVVGWHVGKGVGTVLGLAVEIADGRGEGACDGLNVRSGDGKVVGS